MLRTQISLTVEERRLLDVVAARTGRSVAALIRDAVTAVYGTGRTVDEDLAVMRSAFGAWTASDDDDRDGSAWVDRLRPGTRLADADHGQVVPAE
jgi:Ribbon-helix-helix protein, copG family